MQRSLTVLTRSLLTPLMFLLPLGTLQASTLNISQEKTPIQKEGKIIAELPGFQTKFNISGFDAKSNGFSFTNKEMTKQFEPIANRLSMSMNDEGNDGWNPYLRGTLLWFFGPEVCMNQEAIQSEDLNEIAKKCILTAPAKSWLKQNLQSMRYGVCEGMSTASLYLWLAKIDPEKYKERTNFYTDPQDEEFKELLKDTPINELTVDQELIQKYIANLFILQSLKNVSKSTQEIRETEKPSQILERLIGSMQLNSKDHYTMGIYKNKKAADKEGKTRDQEDDTTPIYKLTEGHSITPFAVEEKDKDKGIYWVYVYDSNHSGKTPYVEFNTKEETWSYKPDTNTTYKGDHETKNLDLTRLSLRDLPLNKPDGEGNYYDCPFCGDESNSSRGTQAVDIFLNGQGELSITDLEENEIDGIDSVPFKGGLGKDVPPFYHLPSLPSEKPYKITLTGIEEEQKNAELTIVGPDFTVGFEDINLSQGQKLVMYVYPGKDGPKLTFQGSNNTEIPTLYFALHDESTLTSYEFRVSNIMLSEGNLVQVVADTERKRLYFGDTNKQKDDYTLKMDVTIIGDKGAYSPPLYKDGENKKTEVTVTVPVDQVAYFAYGEWRANYFIRQYKTAENLPFYAAKFQPLGSANGQAFNENTVKPIGNLFRNSGGAGGRR